MLPQLTYIFGKLKGVLVSETICVRFAVDARTGETILDLFA